MMSLYTSARLAKDTIAVLYYQCVLTAITVLVALVIGILQFLNMIVSIRPDLSGPFWGGVVIAGDHYDIIGGGICGSFIVFGVLSVVLYRPWRRRIDKRRHSLPSAEPEDQFAEDTMISEDRYNLETIQSSKMKNNAGKEGMTTTSEDLLVGEST